MLALGGYEAFRQVRETRLRQEQIATWAATSFDTWFYEAKNNLEAAAAYPDLLGVSAGEQDRLLHQVLLRSPSFRYVALANARPIRYGTEIRRLLRGEQVGSSTGASLTGTEWFGRTADLGFHVSAVDYAGGVPTVIVASPVYSQTVPIGVIAAEMDLTSAYNSLQQFADPVQGNYVYVVSLRGWPILHTADESLASTPGQRVDVDGVKAAVGGTGMPLAYRGLNRKGEYVLGGYQRITHANWAVIAEQPVAWLAMRFLPLAAVVVGFVLLSAGAAVGVGVTISRRVAQPVVRLQEGAQRIGTGDLEHRIILRGYNELSALAEEFNRMAGNLQVSLARQEAWSRELEEKVAERTGELTQAMEQLRREAEAREQLLLTIQQISSPVIPVMEGVIVMPIVGALDSIRAQRVMDDLLAGLERSRARVVIVDITGLAVLDTAVANALLQSARAARLLGAQPILVGITPEVAETVVELGVDLRDLLTAATLQEGLRQALRLLQRKIVST